MNIVFVYVSLIVFGLCLGSFAGAQVWRLRARQLKEDKAAGEAIDKVEYRRLVELTEHRVKDDRSICLHCRRLLKWYDLLPLVSWVSTAGRCRYCRTFIGWFEPLIELGTAVLFVVSFAFWPVPLTATFTIIQFSLWLIVCVGLMILLAYDAKWLLLPDRVTFPLVAIGIVIALMSVFSSGNPAGNLLSLAGALIILSGIYLFIWWLSKGRWIGFGDIKIGLVLALILGDYQLAFIALFSANLLGCIVVLIGLSTHRIKAKTHLPLGPLLIVGTIIAKLYGQHLLQWYFSLTL